jgi:hypothetical protein
MPTLSPPQPLKQPISTPALEEFLISLSLALVMQRLSNVNPSPGWIHVSRSGTGADSEFLP